MFVQTIDGVVHGWYGGTSTRCGRHTNVDDFRYLSEATVITCLECLSLPYCECPSWWFPSDRRARLRATPPDGALSHHSDCPWTRWQQEQT